RNEVVVLDEVPAHFRREEDNGCKNDQEAGHAHDVVHRVVGVEGNAVDGMAIAVFGTVFDLDAVGVVRAYFMQGYDVRYDQADDDQRNGNDVEGKETVQCGIGNDI